MFEVYAERVLSMHPGATDMFLAPGRPPLARVDGRLVEAGERKVTSGDCRRIMADLAKKAGEPVPRFTNELTVESPGGRWRVSLFRSMGEWRVAARRLKESPPPLDRLGFPRPALSRMFDGLEEGLVLFAGPTGAGKTTTCMALVRRLLESRPIHAVTVEDPVEYILPDGRGLASQREVGKDVETFSSGLRDALRQDPDLIVPGEIRDPETASVALQAAETGHLVAATIHAATLEEAVGRIAGLLERPGAARRRLAGCLRLLLVQRLVDGPDGRVPQFEAVRGTPAAANMIAAGREKELRNEAAMQGLLSRETG